MDGIKFDSQAESRRYGELKLLERAHQISSLKIHPVYQIEINGALVCKVELDFSYYDVKWNRFIHEDVKGKDNRLSQLKRKLVEATHGIKVEIVK